MKIIGIYALVALQMLLVFATILMFAVASSRSFADLFFASWASLLMLVCVVQVHCMLGRLIDGEL